MKFSVLTTKQEAQTSPERKSPFSSPFSHSTFPPFPTPVPRPHQCLASPALLQQHWRQRSKSTARSWDHTKDTKLILHLPLQGLNCSKLCQSYGVCINTACFNQERCNLWDYKSQYELQHTDMEEMILCNSYGCCCSHHQGTMNQTLESSLLFLPCRSSWESKPPRYGEVWSSPLKEWKPGSGRARELGCFEEQYVLFCRKPCGFFPTLSPLKSSKMIWLPFHPMSPCFYPWPT